MIMFDIDGTLLDHEKKLPVSAKEAIKSLKEVGHGSSHCYRTGSIFH